MAYKLGLSPREVDQMTQQEALAFIALLEEVKDDMEREMRRHG